MPVTLTEIAEASNVSVSLVSRLIRNDPVLRVSEATRQRVLANKARLEQSRGIRKTPGASTGPATRSNGACPLRTFMVSMDTSYRQAPSPSVGMDSFQVYRLIEEIELQLGELGHTLALNYCADPARAAQAERAAGSDHPADGLIYLLGTVDPSLRKVLLDRAMPHVIYHPLGDYDGLRTVRPLKEESFRLLVNHLLALGHERIGYVGCRQRRYPWFASAMLSVGQPVDPRGLCELDNGNPLGAWSDWRGLANRAYGDWLDSHPPQTFTAMVAENDFVAFGIIDALQARGLQVGRDVSVVSYGNIEPTMMPEDAATLTTIDEQIPRLTRRMIAMLLDQTASSGSDGATSESGGDGTHEVVPGKLIARRSAGPPAT